MASLDRAAADGGDSKLKARLLALATHRFSQDDKRLHRVSVDEVRGSTPPPPASSHPQRAPAFMAHEHASRHVTNQNSWPNERGYGAN